MTPNPSNELLGPLLTRFLEDARELRYRVMDLPNPSFETEAGECNVPGEAAVRDGLAEHSWRCPARDGGPAHKPTREEIRIEIRHAIGAALFAVLDGYGEDVTRIERVTLPIETEVV